MKIIIVVTVTNTFNDTVIGYLCDKITIIKQTLCLYNDGIMTKTVGLESKFIFVEITTK
jgi:hypothetical protein